jgi:REP element-mobilizing transposase RayT
MGILLSMPHSLSAVYIHLVFSTKNREPTFRDKQLRQQVHAYLGGVSRELECSPLLVGGVEDHVHILARFGRTITQATWIKELKRVSNAWIQRQGREFRRFHWQDGYSDFSVSHSNLDRVQAYIARQEEHHRKRDFQDELRALLRRHQIPYDEKHLWD